MMMWSRFIRILSEMQKGSKYFLTMKTDKKFCCYKLVKSYKDL